jgi:DNA mismatch repair protein MutS
MNYNKEILVSNYFDIHNFYKKSLGDNVIILMQVGSFHECYGTDNDGPNLNIVADKLDFIVTKKNKSKELSCSNPYMIGAPSYGVEDIVEKLINNNYIVVRIDQTTEPPKPKREIIGIYTPSTYIEKNSNQNNYLISIVFDIISKNNNKLLCCGITSYDMSTGKGNIYEIANKPDDNIYVLDEMVHYLETFPPKEVILDYTENYNKYMEENNNIYNFTTNEILSYIGLSDINKYSSRDYKMIKKASYQQTLLNEIFNHNSKINIIEDLELQYFHLARLSLSIMMEFIKNNNNNLLMKLEKPSFYSKKDTLFLGNKSLEQLDVFNRNNCLFNIINNTKTPLGKRLLKDTISNPTSNIDVLNNRYNTIEEIINSNLIDQLKDSFNNINDITKLIRRIVLNKIHPYEFYNLYTSIKKSLYIFEYLNNLKITNKFNIDIKYISSLKKLICFIDTNFDIDYMMNINYTNYKEETHNYIIQNKELEDIAETIKMSTNFMDYLVKELEKYIEEKKFMNKNKDTINLKFNERDGYYLLLTKRRSKLLLEKLKNVKEIKVGKTKIKIEDLEFQDLPKSNNVKIFCKEIKTISNNVIELKYNLATKIKENFYKLMLEIYDNYNESLYYTANKIAYLDFVFSGAITASKFGYCKPIINNSNNKSYFDAKNLRHPIVERINEDFEYKPHNISLGKDNFGILLYGINSSGKSTLMKSIGLNIIMAQIGYYVSATEFIYFPYNTLMTRISGMDNIFKGMSSFMVEMMELIAILKRNDSNTLVLGDEICRGTEEKSANIIVTYMLEVLEKYNTSFITATHLHQIAEMESVKKLKNVKSMHLKVEYDDENQKLIYSRTLCEGQGDKYYGVQVAKYLMRDDYFNKRTKELEEEYENINIKKSRYNANVLMTKCEICETHKKLEYHHINFQKDFTDGILKDKPHIMKDAKYNGVVLCQSCHDKVDRNEIIINGWIETSEGRELDYKLGKKKKNKKYDSNKIKLIKSIQELNLSLEQSKNILKEKHNLKISKNTINKIWTNQY